MVQASSGEFPLRGWSDVSRVLLKIVGTLLESAVAVIVMVEVLVAPDASVTLAGAKAQDAPCGNPVQVSETGPAKPLVEASVTG
jgi:hypothetical protein